MFKLVRLSLLKLILKRGWTDCLTQIRLGVFAA